MAVETRPVQLEGKERLYVGLQTREIISSEPKSLQKALEILPSEIQPYFFNVTLAKVDSEDVEEFGPQPRLRQFDEKKVIPWSTFYLEWEFTSETSDDGHFRPSSSTPFDFLGSGEEVKEAIFKGCLPNKINLSASCPYGLSSKPYQKFIEEEIWKILSIGPYHYHVHGADLALAFRTNKDKSHETDFNTAIGLSHKKDTAIIKVNTAIQLSQQKIDALNSWLGELVKIQ